MKMIRRNWPLLACLALTLLFFYRHAFSDFIMARGDTFAYFYPYWYARNAALMAGRLPLWTPDLFAGVPLLANSQIGTFYPPNWLMAPLSPPDGIRISLLLHIAWMAAGAYMLARAALGIDRLPALLAAVIFTFGGYMGGRVEQINQLQGLAWLPWLFWLTHRLDSRPARYAPLLAGALALQFFTGHTQTVFIGGVGMGLYILMLPHRWRRLLWFALAGVGALVLALPQLIPTFELTSVSNRRGGLNQNEATAFSFNPFLAARALLPNYDQPIFAEYITYPGIVALGLALLGLLSLPQERARTRLRAFVRAPQFPWLVLALIGLLFAFGQYSPVYWQLAALPGFNLFRVPARWLVLFALGGAMLAGLGLQALSRRVQGKRGWASAALIALTAVLALGALTVTAYNPEPIPFSPPQLPTLIGWGISLLITVALLIGGRDQRVSRYAPVAAFALVIVELFLAARTLPYNRLTPPDTFSGQRFTASQMQVYDARETPPGRLLSITDLLFDPGDKAALTARYRRLGMSDEEIEIALIAIKHQETLAANLPLYWGIPTLDGFDGGVLPTGYYTAFTSLLLPPDELRTIDGRLREMLARPECDGACIPDQRWLDLTNTRYLLLDKIYDIWHEDIAYDTTFTRTLATGERLTLTPEPLFDATALYLLCADSADCAADVRFTDEDGSEATLTPATNEPLGDDRLAIFRAPDANAVTAVTIEASAPLSIRAVTLVDERSGDFQQLTFAPWSRVLSSDIKLYENQSVLPRAFVAYDIVAMIDDIYGTEDALKIMREADYDPARTALVMGLPADDTAPSSLPIQPATIASYTPEQVTIEVDASEPGYLLLTDAYYPGWRATVNGVEALIHRADVMFRAVAIPQGHSTVVFDYHPDWLDWLPLMGVPWLLLIGFTAVTWTRSRVSSA
ncbi:MAG: YfhO family protein [Anaerolineae bacterium]|nr:YfhO family protein [Anaerolineae bacterium]